MTIVTIEEEDLIPQSTSQKKQHKLQAMTQMYTYIHTLFHYDHYFLSSPSLIIAPCTFTPSPCSPPHPLLRLFLLNALFPPRPPTLTMSDMACAHNNCHTTTINGACCDPKTKRPKLSFITPSEIESEFSHHDPHVARINNGSFGSCPQSIISAQRHWQLQFLRQPDDFYFNHLKPGILRSRSLIKSFINADSVEQISLVDNATTAAAIVFQKAARAFSEGRYNKGDVAIMLHYAYGAVKKSVEAYFTRAGGHVIEVQLPFPVKSNEEIITEFRRALERGKADGSRKVRLAVIDHVTSMPSVVIPVKELVQMCREEGVEQVFVDAAHGIGCVDVDMKEIGADFYTSNLHKWFFCPPAVAFLYCRRAGNGNGGERGGDDLDLHHPVVSHEYGNGLAVESAWIGTRDYSAQLVVPSALEFIDRFEGGIEGIKKRNHEAVLEMSCFVTCIWGINMSNSNKGLCFHLERTTLSA